MRIVSNSHPDAVASSEHWSASNVSMSVLGFIMATHDSFAAGHPTKRRACQESREPFYNTMTRRRITRQRSE